MSDADDADATDSAAPSDRGFRDLLETLSSTYSFDFREYKEASLARRIRARMSQVRVDGFGAYTEYLAQHPEEHIALFNTILINVTGFFRDPEAWKILAADVIPRIVADAANSSSIRVWSAGCSSGEETYSVAMLLAEHLGNRAGDFLIKIYGTDVDEEALTTARHGVYRIDQLKDVPAALTERYFVRDGQLYRVRRDLRRWCIFGTHNLIQAPPLSHIDLLLCRNALIYFTGDLQERILARFHYALREDGYLFLGRSESLLARSRLFSPRHLKWRVFQRMPSSSRLATTPPDRDRSTASLAGDDLVRAELPSGPNRAQQALEALPVAVMLIDMTDTILTWNLAAEQLFDVPVASALARKFRDLDVSYRVEGLRARIEEVKVRHAPVRMPNTAFARRDGAPVHADIAIAPLFEAQRLLGVVVSAVEATEYARLREQMTRVAEQHATAIEELQSTNEELETTNEELQSTNEELETTNEELQSTNEELETTVEELQAANTELGTLNAELESRTAELHRIDAYLQSIINSFNHAVIVMDRAGVVKTWNEAAERTWGLRAEQVVNRDVFTVHIPGLTPLSREAFGQIWDGAGSRDFPATPYIQLDGEVRPAVLRVSPLRDATGLVLGAIAVLSPDEASVGRGRSTTSA